ncbi:MULTISPECIES: hypothetical protein [unclassified Streptomyces]|uniref:hypothetical protein n=1 Tax=unclassified Streptomyces TaxID=2593676 RepID=UPI000978E535|nr:MULTISPECIES: hypothetical protein [unclassified Streptomyces]ONI48643.1 hypothetical protein STIB_71970 [Streptomyces sp. IB2014 011-1]RDV48178.1 hypothetical protein DDV98_28835 [Streptomyces sp. IB2014 011-12]
MAGARHFRKNQPAAEVKQEIEADIASSRRVQQDLAAAGNHKAAESMRAAADEYLDERADLDAGTWRPKHA